MMILVVKAALVAGEEMQIPMKVTVHLAALVVLVEKAKLAARAVQVALAVMVARMEMEVMVAPVAPVVTLPIQMWEKAALAALVAPVDTPVDLPLQETNPAIPAMVAMEAPAVTAHPTNPALREAQVALPDRSLPLLPVIRLPQPDTQEILDMVAPVVVESHPDHQARKAPRLLNPVVKHRFHRMAPVQLQYPHPLAHPVRPEHRHPHCHLHAAAQIYPHHHHPLIREGEAD